MNILYISPEFPPNFQNFCKCAHRSGIKVYAIGEANFYEMPEDLRNSLSWYLKTNMQDNEEIIRNVAKFHEVSGGLDLVESHNEHWIRTEAFINSTFNISGVKEHEIDIWKKKSAMKDLILKNNLPAAPGKKVTNLSDALDFCNQHGYPVILKPDEGVGAYNTYKIESVDQMRETFRTISGDYFVEKFLTGRMVTYDGLTDRSGNVIFDNSLVYGGGVLDSVQGDDTFFYVRKEIPSDLSTLGKQLVQIFKIKRKFFHFEFFETASGLIVLEINARAPGGPILDLFNYSINGDLYQGWVDVILNRAPTFNTQKISYVAYAGRKERNYQQSHEQIVSTVGPKIIEHGANAKLFAQGMGAYKYIFRSENEQEINQLRKLILG